MDYLVNISVFLTTAKEGKNFSFQKITAVDPDTFTVLHNLIGFSEADKAFCPEDNLMFSENEFFSPNENDEKASFASGTELKLVYSKDCDSWDIVYTDNAASLFFISVPLNMLKEEYSSDFS